MSGKKAVTLFLYHKAPLPSTRTSPELAPNIYAGLGHKGPVRAAKGRPDGGSLPRSYSRSAFLFA